MIKDWTNAIDFRTTILAIQELKVQGWTLQRRLQSILPDGKFVIDYSRSGKGRVGLLIHQSFRVLSEGVSGKGYAAWVKLQIGEKEVGIVGIHAPNKRKPRIRAWKWVAELIGTGNWIVMGDLNQVELRTDTLGPSPLLHGKEERVWKNLVLRKDVVDCYMVAAWKKRPRLTRHARRGNQVDRARLDRVYVSDGCSWVDHVNSIQHFGGRTQGDHVPVLVKIALDPLEPQQGKQRSYYKLNDRMLKNEMTKAEVKRVWEDHDPSCTDPRRRWKEAWAWVKDFCKKQQQEDQSIGSRIKNLRSQVDQERERITFESSKTEIGGVLKLEEELRNLEKEDADFWR
ncbi:hypothetical protein R1flu_011812 [Riccia fluitans]|uniref:Endonuclease/exonuclease/phosphatase domain-containing protein n=1 Tax=Riccia fluitans TaxID=41844 RepID=A0ABD1Z9S2_9MARC